MKKKLIASCSMMLFCLMLFYGCRKETANKAISNSVASSDNLQQQNCRLTNVDWGDGTSWHFHYNDKGLADEWILDFGDGLPHRYTMEYNNCSKLIKAYDHFNNTIYTNNFTYNGNKLVKQTWRNNTIDDKGEVHFTYNSKGEIIREDDVINDFHTMFVYNSIGNCTHYDFYLGKTLYLTADFTFRIPNKNPLLTVKGVDLGFTYYTLGLWNKWWETSDRYVLYDNGNPIVVVDDAPSKTVMNFGKQQYPSSVSYYDKVSKTAITNILSYENCPGGCDVINAPSSKAAAKNSRSLIRSLLLLPGSAKSIKEKIKELRN
jgi:hypothetical protein